MIGCLLLIPIAGLLTMMGIYMSSLMAYFVGIAGVMGVYMAGMASYFTAFFIIMFGWVYVKVYVGRNEKEQGEIFPVH